MEQAKAAANLQYAISAFFKLAWRNSFFPTILK